MKTSGGKIRIGAVAIVGVAAFAMVAVATLTVTHAQLATSPWPMFGHDLAHTGRSLFDTSANHGNVKWAFATGYEVIPWPAIGSDGTIYVGCVEGLCAVNPDGTQKWVFSTPGPVESSPTIGVDGTIYIGDAEYVFDGRSASHLYAINPGGTQKWAFPTADPVSDSPTIGTDGTIYFGDSGSYGGVPESHFYAINSDGIQKWVFAAGAGEFFSPAVGTDGTIYVGDSGNDYLYAFNAVDGTQKWAFPTAGSVASPAIGADGTIYVGDFEADSDGNVAPSHLYAINPNVTTICGGLYPYACPKQKWAFTTGGGTPGGSSSPAIDADGTIYIGDVEADPKGNLLPSHVYAVNPDGTKKWVFATGSPVASSPAIGGDGTIYIGDYYEPVSSPAPRLYAINPDGTQRWALAGDTIKFSAMAIGADGTIYFGTFDTLSEDGNLYAVGAASSPTATATPTATTTATRTPTATPTPISFPEISINPHSLAFGNKVKVGKTSKARTVTIKNVGSSKNTGTGFAVSIEMETASPSVFAVKSECVKTLVPRKSCKASVTFKPTDTTPQTGSLMIYDNVTGSPQTVGLSGTGDAVKKK